MLIKQCIYGVTTQKEKQCFNSDQTFRRLQVECTWMYPLPLELADLSSYIIGRRTSITETKLNTLICELYQKKI